MTTPRKEVYAAVDGERDYQDAKWNPDTTPTRGLHSVAEWLVYLDDYVREALHIVTREADPAGAARALENVRKVAALAVACMEQHGAPSRNDVTAWLGSQDPSG